MWCRNVAAGLASLRRPARARAATSIPPRSAVASKRPRKGPETKTMQNSPCRDHATTLRRPCNTLQSPLQKPCSTPGGGGGPEKKRPPGNPEKTLKKKKRPPPPAGGQSAGPQQMARQQEACKLHLAVIDQEPLRSGRPSLRTPLSPPCFKILFTSGTETHMFFSIRIAARAKTLRGHVHEVAVQPSPPRKAVADSVPQRAPPLVVIVVVSVGAVAVVVDPPPSSPPTL